MKRWLAMAGMGAGLALAAWAQAATPLHAKVSVNWARPGIPVADALRDLGAKANVRFAFADEIMAGLDPVTLTMDDVAAGRVAMRILRPRGLTLATTEGSLVTVVKADPFDELRPKREEVFAFARKPTLTRRGDDVTITFETKGWCDVTVAIEHGEKIVRHLASGVLGMNAPEPFVWNSKAQTIVWDGKDDAGVYVDDKDAVTVRVSLGLKPRFERTLYWSPERRARYAPRHAMAAAPEGVYVFDDSREFDHLRLFNREGLYARTVYPFPRHRLDEVDGLRTRRFPDGAEVPRKGDYLQASLLCDAAGLEDGNESEQAKGTIGLALAAVGERIALTDERLRRLAADGSSGGLPLLGPGVARRRPENDPFARLCSGPVHVSTPKRIAFSPDGAWLYLARHMDMRATSTSVSSYWRHTVQRMAFDGNDPPEIFLGTDEPGSAEGRFHMPSDVDTDARGRVYVADHLNHRVQIFSPQGEFLHAVPVSYPAQVSVHQRTGELYVFCWPLPRPGRGAGYSRRAGHPRNARPLPEHGNLPEAYTRLHKYAFVEGGWREIAAWNLPMRGRERQLPGVVAWARDFENYNAIVDSWAEPTTIWVGPSPSARLVEFESDNLLVLREQGDRLEVVRDFHEETRRALQRAWSPLYQRQRLYVNPATGELFKGSIFHARGERHSHKSIQQVVRIHPEDGRVRVQDLPFNTEDLAFDRDGYVYLRTENILVRYCPETWREIPFDYGVERSGVAYGGGALTRTAAVISGAVFPGNVGRVGAHHGGMHVSARGRIAVATLYDHRPTADGKRASRAEGPWRPLVYRGRRMTDTIMLVHILDRQGRRLAHDAVPGLWGALQGLGLDAADNLYLLFPAARLRQREHPCCPRSGTLMKFAPGQGRLLTTRGAPVPMPEAPKRPRDVVGAWVEGADWMVGGMGWNGRYGSGGWLDTRFALDCYARSFTPEPARFSVGVLDANGNLILRIGQYGNVDDGMPLIKEGGPPNPRSIGPLTDSLLRKETTASDEVALMHPSFVATHSDRRLFVADPGNARIVSVRLGYHTDETMALKNVPDGGESG